MTRSYFRRNVFVCVFCAALIVAAPAQAQTYTVIYDAPAGEGISNPQGQADAQGRNGNLYFTAAGDGAGYGALFEITPSGAVTIVYTQGFTLAGGATLGTDGNFYGTDYNGGGCCGQVWRITPAGVGTILHTFNGTDGIYPVSDVIEGTNGKFYGTTPYNNSDGPGTAYSVTSNGTFTTLHTFASSEGSNIDAGLVQRLPGTPLKVSGSRRS